MKCPACLDYFDESRQSVSCAHRLLHPAALPVGGPRMPEDQRAAIEEAYRGQDQIVLWRMMGHNNPAVRSYARELSEMLDMVLTAPAEPHNSINLEPVNVIPPDDRREGRTEPRPNYDLPPRA
jgi:hypothetical protein